MKKKKIITYLQQIVILTLLFMILCTIAINAQTPHVLFSTFIGGNGSDYGHAIAVDSVGSIYVAGITYPTDFPVSTDAYQKIQNNGDVFVSKLNKDGNKLLYSTLVGGSGIEYPFDIAVDQTGSAYVTGVTYSSDFLTSSKYVANQYLNTCQLRLS